MPAEKHDTVAPATPAALSPEALQQIAAVVAQAQVAADPEKAEKARQKAESMRVFRKNQADSAKMNYMTNGLKERACAAQDHKQPTVNGNISRLVLVHPNLRHEFVICQLCHAVIKPMMMENESDIQARKLVRNPDYSRFRVQAQDTVAQY